jgi:hypothetical protein
MALFHGVSWLVICPLQNIKACLFKLINPLKTKHICFM